MQHAVYNSIGKTYDTTRKADPAITQTVIQLLEPVVNGNYLDLACGSGNYTIALHNKGLTVDSVDISDAMLNKAKAKSRLIKLYLGNAESLPFSNNYYDGVTCILATHHMNNLNNVCSEVYRILKPQGKFVILTSTPEQMSNYWLCEYFPDMMNMSKNAMKSINEWNNILASSGFTEINYKPFFVTDELQDFFLYSGKYCPEMYLDQHVRNGISSFQFADQQEIDKGLSKLEQDIRSSNIDNIIKKQYTSNTGDYLFISCTNRKANSW